MQKTRRHAAAAARLLAAALMLAWFAPVEDARAQVELKWLDVGDLANAWSSSGSYGLAGSGMVWPYIHGSTGGLHGYHDGHEIWFGARNWTDAEGKTWPYKIAYTNRNEVDRSVFPQEFKLVSKYPQPRVEVDLLETRRIDVDVDEVDPDMEADRMLVNRFNTVLGLTIEQRIYAFSQEYHDDYHIIETIITNTGNVDGDPEIELPDQTVEGIYMWWDRRWGQSFQTSDVIGRSTRWGRENMHDIVRDGDLRANYTWTGRVPNFTDYDPIGAPAIDAEGSSFDTGQDTTGRLHAIGYAATFAVHAETSADDPTDDLSQPVTLYYHDANDAQASGTDHQNEPQMRTHYEDWFQAGTVQPFQAWVVQPDGDFAHQTSLNYPHNAGARVSHGYGPYTLGPGESVRIIVGEAVAGLPYRAALEIGRQYKKLLAAGNEFGDIAYDADHDGTIEDGEIMDKNEWAIDAARDTVIMVMRRALANWDAGLDIPQPPPPPTEFIVTSVAGGIELDWTYPYDDPAGGFELYRSTHFFGGSREEDYEAVKIAELPGDARSYTDTDVIRGLRYFYHLRAVGPVNADPTGNTPTGVRLRSSRYYTQTYAPASPLREPGETLAQARVVPNPFHVGAGDNIRYPGAERIGFLDIPGQATIRIFTERGDLVKVIEHTDGTGDEFWNLQTDGQQLLVSGLYIAAIVDHETGETRFMKFIVIR